MDDMLITPTPTLEVSPTPTLEVSPVPEEASPVPEVSPTTDLTELMLLLSEFGSSSELSEAADEEVLESLTLVTEKLDVLHQDLNLMFGTSLLFVGYFFAKSISKKITRRIDG